MNMQSTMAKRILVLAANGKTGTRLIPRLESRGVEVRPGSRSAAIPFDWDEPATWEAALAGMDAAYVVYTPDLAVPRAPQDLRRFTTLAKEMGLKKLVLLSGRGEPEAQRCEQIVQNSGLAWTIVRASWFSQNFSEGEFTSMVLEGVIALPNPQIVEPFIDVDDIADVAAVSLTDARHDGEIYEVTGPELLTFADVAQQLTGAIGRPVAYQPITGDQFVAGLHDAGVPGDFIELLGYLFDRMATGVNAHISDGVERALGRPPRSFRTFANQAAARWDMSRV